MGRLCVGNSLDPMKKSQSCPIGSPLSYRGEFVSLVSGLPRAALFRDPAAGRFSASLKSCSTAGKILVARVADRGAMS